MGLLEKLSGLVNRLNPINRRRFQRYDVAAPVLIRFQGTQIEAEIHDISATGARVVPTLPFPAGGMVTVYHPLSDMTYEANLLRHNDDDSRIQFTTNGDGTVISLWMRGLEHKDQ